MQRFLLTGLCVLLVLAAGCKRKAAEPTSPSSPAPATVETPHSPIKDPEKEQLRVFVRQHAQDPDAFEILSWGERKGKTRMVRFRCKVIAIATEINNGPFHRAGGSPISLDTARLEYSEAGKIVSCYLSEAYRFWR